MKRRNFLFVLFAMFLLSGSLSLNAQVKKTYLGDWSFDAPSAPEGYISGIITLKKDSSFMQFTDGYYRYPSSWLKAKSDSIIYQSNIDGEIVLFSLKIKDKTNIAGDAVWSSGQTVMILTKKED
jgi:hypothetical protein